MGAAVPLPGTGAALELGPHRELDRDLERLRVEVGHLHAAAADVGGGVEHRLHAGDREGVRHSGFSWRMEEAGEGGGAGLQPQPAPDVRSGPARAGRRPRPRGGRPARRAGAGRSCSCPRAAARQGRTPPAGAPRPDRARARTASRRPRPERLRGPGPPRRPACVRGPRPRPGPRTASATSGMDSIRRSTSSA